MSKLLNQYNQLKKENASCIYIFRVGIFYNMLNEDAKIVNEKLGLKLTSLGPEIIKCGFPLSSLDNYTRKLKELQLKYIIIDNLPNSNIHDYLNNIEIKKTIKKIAELDMNNITFHQAFDILQDIQVKFKQLI